MDTEEQGKEGQGNAYPDPSSQSAGIHPFYTDQQSRDVPIPQAPTAPMHGGSNDPKGYPQDYMRGPYPQPSTPQQLAQQGLNVNQSHRHGTEDSLKKKQKVSRACDECRRKKVSVNSQDDMIIERSDDIARSNVMRNQKTLVFDARHAVAQIQPVNSADSHRSGAQAKGINRQIHPFRPFQVSDCLQLY